MFQRIAIFVIGVTFATSASAGFIYDLKFSFNSITLNQGDTISVDVLFEETATGLDTPLLGSQSTNSLEIGVMSSSFSAERTLAGDSSITSFSPNSGFDSVSTVSSGDTTSIGLAVVNSLDPVFAGGSGKTRTVTLGTLNFVAGTAGSTNIFNLADFGTSDDFVIDDGIGGLGGVSGLVLDSQVNFGSFTLNVNPTAVPEPSSFLLLAVGVGGYAYRRRRTARKGLTTAANS